MFNVFSSIFHLNSILTQQLPCFKKKKGALFYKADPNYGTRVAKGLGLNIKKVEQLAAMTQEDRVKTTAQ